MWGEVSWVHRLRVEQEGGGLERDGDLGVDYRGTSLIRNLHPVGPYGRTMPRLLGMMLFCSLHGGVHCPMLHSRNSSVFCCVERRLQSERDRRLRKHTVGYIRGM